MTLTVVSGPAQVVDSGFPHHRLWVRWFDDRGTWRTHLMFAYPPLVARYWQHAGFAVRIVNAIDQRLEQQHPEPVAYYTAPHHPSQRERLPSLHSLSPG